MLNAYPAVLTKDAGGRMLVSFLDFPEVHTYGDDVDEAVERARDALATILDSYIRDRQRIPEPSVFTSGTYRISVPALTQAKVDLYQAMQRERVNKTTLARRLGWHLPQVDRLLDVHHGSRLDQLERAFRALGKEVRISTVDLPPPREVPREQRRSVKTGAGVSPRERAAQAKVRAIQRRHRGARQKSDRA